MPLRRFIGIAVAASIALTGCASKEDEMTDRIRDGLPEDSVVSRVLDDQPTEFREISLPQVPAWRLAEISATGERPFKSVVAYRPEGEPRTVVLTGNRDRWSEIVEGGEVTDPKGAEQLALAWYDATRRTDKLDYRVSSVDDVDWQPIVDEQAVERLKKEYADVITAPAATEADGGWAVTVWSVEQRDLVRHDLVIGEDASVTDTAETLERAMPASEAV